MRGKIISVNLIQLLTLLQEIGTDAITRPCSDHYVLPKAYKKYYCFCLGFMLH